MGTVGKAISLLELFTVAEPELGLTDLARRSGFDKATTRRLLVALTSRGFIEQDAATRHYRLGAGLSRLARIREARFPFLQTAVPLVRDLASATAETVHLSEFGTDRLVTVHVEHPPGRTASTSTSASFCPCIRPLPASPIWLSPGMRPSRAAWRVLSKPSRRIR